MSSPSIDRRLGLTGNKAYKAPCDVATTANITLSGEQTIDGVTTSSSRVLVWNQSNTVDNGIWDSSTGSWSRAIDCNTNQDIAKGTQVLVTGGTSYAGQIFEFTSANPIIPGTSAITIVRGISSSTLEARLASTASAADGDALMGVKKTLSGAVARTQHAVNEERVSILDFGAVGDGALTTDAGRPIGAGTGTNNSSFIQAANDAIVAGGKPMILEIPPGIFRCDTGLKINAGFVTLEFRGGALDFRNIGNAKGLQVYSTRQYLNSSRWCIGSGAIYGPVATVSTTSVGLFYESNSGGVGSADIAEVSCNGLNVYHFAESIQVGNNAYMVDHVACNFWFSNRFFYCPSGLTNTGQRWAFPSCQFLNGVNGFYINEATINLELDHAVVVPTGGYAFGLESGYVIMNGGGIEVDSSTGAQLIKNTNAGGGAKSTFIATGANFLYKNTTTQPFIELNSTNTYVTLQGGHASVAAGSVFMTGTGSGNVCLVGVLPDGALDPNSSNTLGAGFGYQVLAQPLTGISVMNKSLTANGLFSNVTPGGSVAALSGSAVNQVSINGTFTTLFTSAGAFLIIVRDNTAGGMAVLCYDAGSGVIQTLANNIAATVAFQHTGTALQARTTAGTVTRTMIILAIKV